MPSKTRDVAIRLSLKDSEVTKRALMQLGTEGQRALQRIERRAQPASRSLRGLNAASGRLRGGLEGVAGRAGSAGKGFNTMSSGGLAAAAAIGAVVVAVSRLKNATEQAVEFVAAIGDQAEQAGVTVEAFQEYRAALDKLSISEDAVVDGFKELNLRADEFAVTGKGPAAEAFQRLRLGQEDVNKLLGDSDALFETVIARMEELDDTAGEIRVADELFGGTAGEQFVRAVNAGVAKIREFRQEAREMGLVIDAELIKRADESRDKLKALGLVIETNLNSALVDLAPALVTVAKGFATVAREVALLVESFRDVENKSKLGLESAINETSARIRELEAQRAELEVAHNQDPDRLAGATRNIDRELEQRRGELAELEARFAELIQKQAESSKGSRFGGDGTDTQRINEVTAALRFQLEQLDRTAFGQKVFTELQKAGIDGHHREARAITELVRAIYEREQADEAAKEAAKEKLELEKEGERVTDSLRTATEKYADEVERLKELLEKEVITQETYNRGVKKAGEELEETGRATGAVIDGFEDIANAARRGSATWEEAGRIIINVIGDIAESMIEANDTANSLGGLFGGGDGGGFGGILDIVSGFFGGGGSAAATGGGGASFAAPLLAAKGAAFSSSGSVARFAKGGVPDRTMVFPMRGNRFGVMNETPRDEGILPLARTASGDLGVQAVGAGGGGAAPSLTMGDVNVTVESSSGGGGRDPSEDRAFGQMIALAVKETVNAQLMEATRPGGILNQSGFKSGMG